MKTKLSVFLISTILLYSCWSSNVAEQPSIGTQDVPSNSLIQEDSSKKANVSSDTSNEATEAPDLIEIATWETATSTDFISTWSTLTWTWN
jgi:hypothetical protein